jgi:hypothetical protein
MSREKQVRVPYNAIFWDRMKAIKQAASEIEREYNFIVLATSRLRDNVVVQDESFP